MNSASIDQARQILEHQLHLLWEQPILAPLIAPVMLWGAPGTGKSTLIRELCDSQEIGFIDVRLSQREPVDLRGLPVPDGDQVRWLLSSEWPRNPESKGIILFDELTAADRTLQVAAYEFILDRRLGDLYRVPPGWLICAAGNRSEDRAVSMTMSSALANRFCHVELQPDVTQWTQWATVRGLHPDVIGFLRFKPECFLQMNGNLERGWPSPRSWERVAMTVKHGSSLDPAVLALMVTGLVGPGAGTEFLAYRQGAQTLPDTIGLLRGTVPFIMPGRADLRYAVTTSLAHHLWSGPTAERDLWIGNFLRIGQALSSDFAVMAMLDVQSQIASPERADDAHAFFSHSEFQAWIELHGEGLSMNTSSVTQTNKDPGEHGNQRRVSRGVASIRLENIQPDPDL
ncbi:ATP-binding protein [Limnohabitans sp. 2KL-3]|uniref:ATP-binding protein n=1 Tax=Limnohabitans sp. 2KL-3 TaxID=1100700 RepID=UPI000AB84DE9|nr:MoxR family ATPase [Limnohabitans sp. 2KL-3]